MATEVTKFQMAGLPKVDVGMYRQQLQTARDGVSVSSGIPYLKLGKGDGIWVYGKEDTDIEEGSLWAINPGSIVTGVIAWPPQESKSREPIKHMRRVFDASAPIIDKLRLGDPPNGGIWDDCIGWQLQCVGGKRPDGGKIEDIGVVIEYQQNSLGGKQAFDELCKSLQEQLDEDPTLMIPVVSLEASSYKHDKWGTIWKPEFKIVKFVGADGQDAPANAPPAVAAAQPPPEPEQPVRRSGRGRGAAAPAEAAAEQPVQRRRRRAA